jgi:hypothetical protein
MLSRSSMVRRTFRLVGLLGLALCIASVTACSGESEGAAATIVIDEEKGSYRGVLLGGTAAEVEAALGPGRPSRAKDSSVPLNVKPWDYQGPQHTSGPIADDESELLGLRYPEVMVQIDDDRVVDIETMEAGATTARGVAIGDPIEQAAAKYPELECGTIEDWKACQGRLGYRYIWFGGDPIEVIAIGSVRLEGL